MKPRPSLKEVVRSRDVESFIREGKAPEGNPSSPDSDYVRISLDIPKELHDALTILLEGKNITLEQALREMLVEYIAKDWEVPGPGEPSSRPS